MFCSQCANAVEEGATFCSKCGFRLGPARTQLQAHHDMNMHVNVLAWIFIGCAVLMGIAALTAVFAGQLITQWPIRWPPDIPPEAVPFIGSVVVFAGLVCLALAGGVAAAGIGLLHYRNWGRVVAFTMAVILAFWFPFGTAIAIYTFWVLLSEEGRNHYKTRSAEL